MGPPNSKSSKKTPEMNVSELDLIFTKNFDKKYSKTQKLYFFHESLKKTYVFFRLSVTTERGSFKGAAGEYIFKNRFSRRPFYIRTLANKSAECSYTKATAGEPIFTQIAEILSDRHSES